jgi:hypothetical protein
MRDDWVRERDSSIVRRCPGPRPVQIGLYLTNQHPVGSDMVEALRARCVCFIMPANSPRAAREHRGESGDAHSSPLSPQPALTTSSTVAPCAVREMTGPIEVMSFCIAVLSASIRPLKRRMAWS